MSVKLRSIHIENFRSIHRLTIKTSNLSIFVGKNDSGKSNILRALNLFFNNVTNPGKIFNFEEDYNLFAPDRAKTAKEIIVRLEFDIPSTYHQKNGQIIIWERRWRSTGLHSDAYWGQRISTNRRGREVREHVEISGQSNAHTLMKQIEFEYIPAIRDSKYFDQLRGRIYSIIAEVAARSFRNSSTAFEDSIGEHLADLTSEIGDSLGFSTKLALPRDLSPIFQRLDFLSGEKSISLENRGDGIKTRHIPLILKFMLEKKQSLRGRGAAPFSFIWAYEEPENNLEFTNAVELAMQLSEYASPETAQILLTTHSPVFYDLAAPSNTNVSCAHVYREDDLSGTMCTTSASTIDEKMGTMALLAPRLQGAVLEIRNQIEAKFRAEQLTQQSRPKIFVEGESDKIVLKKCAQVFHPSLSNFVDFETKKEGAGHAFVIDMLRAWRSHHKHHKTGPKCAGLVDLDATAQKNQWNEEAGNVQSAKCFCYPKPQHITAALSDGFKVPVTLEVLYPLSVWTWAENQNFLTDRERAESSPPNTVQALLKGEISNITVNPKYEIYVTRNFNTGSKIPTAKYISTQSDDFILNNFSQIGSLLKDVFDYLEINTD